MRLDRIRKTQKNLVSVCESGKEVGNIPRWEGKCGTSEGPPSFIPILPHLRPFLSTLKAMVSFPGLYSAWWLCFLASWLAGTHWSRREVASLSRADEDRGHRPRHGAGLRQARVRGQSVSQAELGSARGKPNEHPRSLWTLTSTGNFHEC